MKIVRKLALVCLICLGLLAALAAAPGQAAKPETIRVNEDIQLIKLDDSLYIHITWFNFPGFGRFPSNGMVLVKNGKALLIDTPVTNAQTEKLHDYIKRGLKAEVTRVIVNHFHADCMGGLGYLHRQKIPSLACDLTRKICTQKGLPIPSQTFSGQSVIEFEGEKVICQHPGGGHTPDNIVVYFPKHNVLFGGCMIKSLRSRGLGNIKDAVVAQWAASVQKVMAGFPEARIVVPGHGRHGDKKLLAHTLGLVKKHLNN